LKKAKGEELTQRTQSSLRRETQDPGTDSVPGATGGEREVESQKLKVEKSEKRKAKSEKRKAKSEKRKAKSEKRKAKSEELTQRTQSSLRRETEGFLASRTPLGMTGFGGRCSE
jgi:hypothetical protein